MTLKILKNIYNTLKVLKIFNSNVKRFKQVCSITLTISFSFIQSKHNSIVNKLIKSASYIVESMPINFNFPYRTLVENMSPLFIAVTGYESKEKSIDYLHGLMESLKFNSTASPRINRIKLLSKLNYYTLFDFLTNIYHACFKYILNVIMSFSVLVARMLGKSFVSNILKFSTAILGFVIFGIENFVVFYPHVNMFPEQRAENWKFALLLVTVNIVECIFRVYKKASIIVVNDKLFEEKKLLQYLDEYMQKRDSNSNVKGITINKDNKSRINVSFISILLDVTSSIMSWASLGFIAKHLNNKANLFNLGKFISDMKWLPIAIASHTINAYRLESSLMSEIGELRDKCNLNYKNNKELQMQILRLIVNDAAIEEEEAKKAKKAGRCKEHTSDDSILDSHDVNNNKNKKLIIKIKNSLNLTEADEKEFLNILKTPSRNFNKVKNSTELKEFNSNWYQYKRAILDGMNIQPIEPVKVSWSEAIKEFKGKQKKQR